MEYSQCQSWGKLLASSAGNRARTVDCLVTAGSAIANGTEHHFLGIASRASGGTSSANGMARLSALEEDENGCFLSNCAQPI